MENDKIEDILSILSLNRNIISADRSFYRTWARDWQFSHELICYSAELARSKAYPMQYMNNLLSKWKENKVETKEDAKNCKIEVATAQSKPRKKLEAEREYSKEDIAGLFTSLEEVEI